MSATTTSASFTIRVNDAPRTVAATTTLADLMRDLGLADRKGIAVAVNDRVVPRATWPAHVLAEAERILVIRATQGG